MSLMSSMSNTEFSHLIKHLCSEIGEGNIENIKFKYENICTCTRTSIYFTPVYENLKFSLYACIQYTVHVMYEYVHVSLDDI